MKKFVSVVLLVCMLVGGSFSTPLQTLVRVGIEIIKGVVIGGGMDIIGGALAKRYRLGWQACVYQEVGGDYDSYQGWMQVCYRYKDGMTECAVIPECLREKVPS